MTEIRGCEYYVSVCFSGFWCVILQRSQWGHFFACIVCIYMCTFHVCVFLSYVHAGEVWVHILTLADPVHVNVALQTPETCVKHVCVSFNIEMKLVSLSNCFKRLSFLFGSHRSAPALVLKTPTGFFFSVEKAGRLSDQCRSFSLLECRFYQHVLSRRQTEGSPCSAKVVGQTVTKPQSRVLHTVSPWQLS